MDTYTVYLTGSLLGSGAFASRVTLTEARKAARLARRLYGCSSAIERD